MTGGEDAGGNELPDDVVGAHYERALPVYRELGTMSQDDSDDDGLDPRQVVCPRTED